ncbi:hypothetical protein B7P43_G16652 [Cryptotermes secundus]|uniref:DNA ligase ATP-dependent N-terminal domain-containing protein n=1 Tax=Cryptotermes secundus TaxID=105785 RepID=A0A2J7RJ09_9NEOP|nr:hypothetical protein B7P43_G16652 [Cryptotermes secundus]
MAEMCTSNDLKMIIRLVKHDLRINAGPKHILEAVHPDAYQAFQMSRDLDAVLSKAVVRTADGHSSPTKKTALKITASLMTPVLPMLPKDNEDHSKEITHTRTSKKRRANGNKSHGTPSRKRRHSTTDTSDNETQETVTSCSNCDTDKTEDEYAIFSNFVANEIRSLNSEEKRRDLKQIIQKTIRDMIELDNNIKDAHVSTTSDTVPELPSNEQSSGSQE